MLQEIIAPIITYRTLCKGPHMLHIGRTGVPYNTNGA